MNHKDDIEQRRAELLKRARAEVRLRHSIEADRELNDLLPALEREYMLRVSSGFLPDIEDLLSANGVIRATE